MPQPSPAVDLTTDRAHAPVFVLGSPRSGTTLLYDMLLSAGGFAVYLAESNVFNLLSPRFGDFGSRASRGKILEAWLSSKLFRASGLEAEQIRRRILQDCRSAGDFLRIVMEDICRMQGAARWAENSPEAMLYLPLIKELIPDALILHIIRDGRDVATSLGKLRYVRPFPWEKLYSVVGCGIYWEWILQQGREFGRTLGGDYMEVRFERLLAQPQETLDRIGGFIHQSLDYATIQRVGYGSVSKPNTSFRSQAPKDGFNPVGRWRSSFTPHELLLFERLVGATLTELGYPLATAAAAQPEDLSLKATRRLHRSFFAAKFWYKNNSLMRLLRPTMKGSDIDEIVLAEDHPPVLRDPATLSH
jgi:hypothetical protein